MYIKILRIYMYIIHVQLKSMNCKLTGSKVTVVLNKVIHYSLHCLEFLLMTLSEKSMILT